MLTVNNSNYFEKSPLNSPSKVLNALDLLSVNGKFLPKSGEMTPNADFLTPTRYRRVQHESVRRQSLVSDFHFEHTISDEFAHIQLNVTERRSSSESITPHKFHKNNQNNQKIVFAKVIKSPEDDEDCEIEIIDLDDGDETPKENLYPNCDANVWLRSCEAEIVEPVAGFVNGFIPEWIKGSLLRNGPGSIKVGDMTYNHLFDSAALLHRFNIENGNVTYQCRFLKSEAFKKNLAANRIVTTEFGTVALADPCQSIFQK